MKERLKLSQLEGDDPELGFNNVILGAKEMYDSSLVEMSEYLPSCIIDKSEFHNSNLLKHINHVKGYVLKHEYKVIEADKYEWSNEPDICFWKKSADWPWSKQNKKPIEIPEELIRSVDTIHAFFCWQFQTISQIYNDLNLPTRCFLLFAQAAKLRLMVDYTVCSDFRSFDECSEDNCYFTFNELALLTSLVCHKNDYQKTHGINNKPLNVLPEMQQNSSISAINYPVHPEFDSLSKGRTLGSRVSYISRENAIIWLHDKSIPYNFTKYY